jgi:hypothetical protein
LTLRSCSIQVWPVTMGATATAATSALRMLPMMKVLFFGSVGGSVVWVVEDLV